MAQLMAAWLAAWLIMAACLTQLVDANGENDRWELESSVEYKCTISCNPFRSLFRRNKTKPPNEPKGVSSNSAALAPSAEKPAQEYKEVPKAFSESLKYFVKITAGQCDDESRLLVFVKSLFFVTEKRERWPNLYELGRESLKHYVDECGLEDRYKIFIKQSKARKPAHPINNMRTLAEELMAGILSQSIDTVFWEIMLLKDARFISNDRVKCNDGDFWAKIAGNLNVSSRLSEYAKISFDTYLNDCGYEQHFKQVADEIFKDNTPRLDKTLAAYVRGHHYLRDGNKIVQLVKFVDYLVSFKATDEQNCHDLGVTKKLVDMMNQIELGEIYYAGLSDYAEKLLLEHVDTCGQRGNFAQVVEEFKKNEHSHWTLINRFVESASSEDTEKNLLEAPIVNYLNRHVKNDDRAKLVEACRQLWEQTYLSLVGTLMQYLVSDEDHKMLVNYHCCAIALGKDDLTVRGLLPIIEDHHRTRFDESDATRYKYQLE